MRDVFNEIITENNAIQFQSSNWVTWADETPRKLQIGVEELQEQGHDPVNDCNPIEGEESTTNF